MELITAFLYIVLALLFLGVIIAFSPTLVITELAILTKSKNPLIHTLAFIAGVALPVLILAALSLILVDPYQKIDIPSLDEEIGPTPLLDLAAGGLFMFGGLKLLKSSPNKTSRFDPNKLLSTKTLFWFGAIKMATSVSSLAAILYAARFLKTNTTEPLQQFAGLLWLLAVTLTPFILIAFSKRFSPKSFDRIQKFSDKVSELNWRRLIALAMVILGIALVISGIFTLDQGQLV